MATYYWVGGAGTFADSAHWSLSSGGAGGAGTPTSSDDVNFDASSGGSGTTKITGGGSCRNLTVTAASTCQPGSNIFGSGINVYGDLSIAKAVSFSDGPMTLCKASGTQLVSITANAGSMAFTGGATYSFQSDVTCIYGDEDGEWTVTSGTLALNGYTYHVPAITFGASSTYTPSGGKLKLGQNSYGAGITVASGAVFDADLTGYIEFFGNMFGNCGLVGAVRCKKMTVLSVAAGNNDVTFATGNCFLPEIEIARNDAGYHSNLVFPITGTYSIGKLTRTSGTNPAYAKLISATPGSRATIAMATPAKIMPSYFTFKDLSVSGGPIYADATCSDGGNNLGVLFGKKPSRGFGVFL